MALQQTPKPVPVNWSEEGVYNFNSTEEAVLIAKAGVLAKAYGSLLGITLMNQQTRRNKFVLIDDAGDVLINFDKVHPVPGMEDIIPGPADVPVTNTKFGLRFGASICFDYDYPQYIRQASQKGIDIMLQPSWTWGSMGRFHSSVNHVRAVENGFTMFRCSSFGYSGVFLPDFSKQSFQPLLSTGSLTTTLPLQQRNFTLYGIVGETFAWACVVFAAIYNVLVFLKVSWLNAIFAKISILKRFTISEEETSQKQKHGGSMFDSGSASTGSEEELSA
jgi:predicted amidohydrolase